MAGVTYRENPAGIREMLAAPFMIEGVRGFAERGAGYARQISPVRTGHYKASWVVEAGIKDGHAHAEYQNHAFYAYFLEKGTRYMEAQHIAARAIDGMRN